MHALSCPASKPLVQNAETVASSMCPVPCSNNWKMKWKMKWICGSHLPRQSYIHFILKKKILCIYIYNYVYIYISYIWMILLPFFEGKLCLWKMLLWLSHFSNLTLSRAPGEKNYPKHMAVSCLRIGYTGIPHKDPEITMFDHHLLGKMMMNHEI